MLAAVIIAGVVYMCGKIAGGGEIRLERNQQLRFETWQE